MDSVSRSGGSDAAAQVSAPGEAGVPFATRVAPGVYRVEAWPATDRAAETASRTAVLAELDALFAANPWEGDVTAIIREMRDSR